jgi:hypothetical protein
MANNLTNVLDNAAVAETVRVLFRIRWPARRALVRISAAGQEAMSVPMDRIAADRWQAVVDLRPGTYLYRYYAGDEQTLVYVPPDEAEGRRRRRVGADAVLRVGGE